MNELGLIAVFIFYSKSSGVQARLAFSEEFRHCNIITFDGQDWVMLDFDKTGLLTRRIYCTEGTSLLRHLKVIPEVSATVTVTVKERAIIGWKPWLVRSCNEICRYASGVDVGFTFNPIHLYWKLLKYRGKGNYEMLSHWRRKHGIFRRR